MTVLQVNRKLAAILSADVRGYSRLMEENEIETIRTLTTYKEIMTNFIQQHKGRVVDAPGDNLLAEFASVVEAVQCGVEIQKELKLKNTELLENRKMEFRIGINLGDVIEDGEQILGDGVNIAARLESLSDAGGVCISGSAYDFVGKKLSLGYEYLGEHKVKNIEKAVRVYRVLMEPDQAGKVIGEERLKPKHLPDKPSIAVLPFDNLSGDPEQDYFADGIVEDIITVLSKFRWLLVIARNTTFRYKGKSVDVKQIARELDVRYLLEGSVRKAGSRVRITAQLINSVTGGHIWAERYDRELTNVFTVQDEITESVVTSIQPEIDRAEVMRARQKPPESLDAWECVLRGRWLVLHMTKENNSEARCFFEKALELDPNYVSALSALAYSHFVDVFFGWSQAPGQSIGKASELVERALRLDESDPWVHCIMSLRHFILREPDKAILHGNKAVELNPSFALAHGYLGAALAYGGVPEAAIAEEFKAIRLSPRDPEIFHFFLAIGTAHFVAGRYEDAVEWAKKVIQERPDVPSGHRLLAASYGQLGQTDSAKAALEGVLRLVPGLSLDLVEKTIFFKVREHSDRFVEGLRKAGLK
jgi:adenylate cyclase